jgi:hypothetical protein
VTQSFNPTLGILLATNAQLVAGRRRASDHEVIDLRLKR